MLREWRNDPETVRFSKSGRQVALDEHESWLARSLRNSDTHIWIAEVSGVPVGQVRLDTTECGGEIDIAVDPAGRRQGVARQLLTHLMREAVRSRVTRLIADVHRDNAGSKQLFSRAGFRPDESMLTKGFLRFLWSPHDSYCFASGVEAGRVALQALIDSGLAPTLVLGYDQSLSSRSGYVDLACLTGDHGIAFHRTADINGSDVANVLDRSPASMLVVAGWSQIVHPRIIERFPLGAVGLHPSRLPHGRGRAPIPWTLINGLTDTAVTLFKLEPTVDTGDVIDVAPVHVGLRDDAAALYARIAQAHADVLVRSLPRLLRGEAKLIPQGAAVHSWPRRRPEDGIIDWRRSATDLYHWVRGLTHPYPGAFTHLPDGRRLMVWAADHAIWAASAAATPGTVLGPDLSTLRAGIAVACGEGVIVLRIVSIDGAAERDAMTLLEDGSVRVGDRCA